MSPDPCKASTAGSDSETPQSWNRHVYARKGLFQRVQMSTRKRVGPVLAILVIVAASVASEAAPPPPQTSEGKNLRARVKILALDSYGKPFGGFKIILFKDDKGSDFGGRFAGSIANDIPFGTY